MASGPRISTRARASGGQPISELLRLALAHPELISLAAGFVDLQTLPVEPTRTALEALLSDRRRALSALQYGTTAGDPRLRSLVLERLKTADGNPPSERSLTPDNLVLTAGSNQFLHLLLDTLLDPGDIVLCASPTYFVFLGMLANLGGRAIGAPMDEHGLIPEGLDEAFAACASRGELERVKAIYLTSYFDNPANVTLSAERRGKIVEIAKRWSKRAGRTYVIEDAAYRPLRYAGNDIPSLRSFDAEGDTVIVAETFSKSFSPGIRVGWGILPTELVAPVLGQKGNIDFGSPHLAQQLMTTVLELGLYDPHVEGLRKSYSRKLAATLDAADAYLAPIPGVQYNRPTGGIYLWLTLPEGVDAGPDSPLMRRAIDEGVLYVAGGFCFPAEGEPVRKNTIRLSFADQEPERIRQGIELLAKAVEKVALAPSAASTRA